MKNHRQKASSALAAGALAITALLISVAPALAAPAVDRPLLFSFDGADTTAGAFLTPRALDIDQTSGVVYVIDEGNGVLDKFNLAGEAQDFSGSGDSSLSPGLAFNSLSDVAVDNSSANPGQIDLMAEQSPVKAFSPAGTDLWELGGFGDNCGIAIDAEGHPWVGDFATVSAREFDNSGAPPVEIGSVAVTEGFPCRLDVDASGNLYINRYEAGVDKYEGGVKVATIDPEESKAVTVDQSSAGGHAFVLHQGTFSEYDSTGALVGSFGEGTIGNGLGIAYSRSSDRVYVADASTNVVKVFGFVTGTVPDVTIEPTTLQGTTEATFSGTVNPQGVPNNYFFEWKEGEGSSWAGAASSPPQSLPEDFAVHAVSFQASGLTPDTTYQVRLVALNTAKNLRARSSIDTFSTSVPSQVETAFAAPRTDTSARLNGRINPKGTKTSYHFEYSIDGANWIVLPTHEADDGKQVVVSEQVDGLQPGATYSYRLVAENEAGPASPQGEERTFTTRTSSEVSELSSCPNEDIRVAQRSTYLGHCRAIELVNNPDKGNQNVLTSQPELGTPPLSPDGNEAIWSVFGGAPGGTTGTGATFLARRTAAGWQSKSLVPPAAEQVGGGEFKYTLPAATADFSNFVFIAGKSVFGSTGTPTILRLNRDQAQTALSTYPNGSIPAAPGVGLSDDGAHVLFINPEIGQLEDVGSGTSEAISLMPDGTPSECGLETGSGFSGPGIKGAATNWHPSYQRVATTDASRAYFEAKPNGECSKSFGLYQRNRETDVTTLIDPGGNGSFGEDAYAIRATPDGRGIYFVTQSQLDPVDTNPHHDVYRWDEDGADSTCLTCVVADANLLFTAADPQAVMVSDDFSHIYFRSDSQLVPGKGTPGQASLYVLSGGAIRFVTAVDDSGDLLGLSNFASSATNAVLSPDGNVLLFRAEPSRSLTSDEIMPTCPNSEPIGAPVQACKQLYRYDDRDRSIECVSCRRGGLTTDAVGSRANSLKYPAFNFSSDGNTIAFVTATSLLPRDVNSGPDIYEWRNGVLHLLTDGLSSFPSSTFGAPAVRSISADGRDILISLVDPGRTGFERDGLANLYDARIGGGFPVPPLAARCSEETCQGPLLPAPPPKRAASSAIGPEGKGKTRKPKHRCAKKRGKAKQRCVRKQRDKRAQNAKTDGKAREAK